MASLPTIARRWRGVPAVLLALLVMLVIGDALFWGGERVLGAEGTDITMQFLPWYRFGFSELAKGNVALRNPYTYAGHPFFGGWQAGLLYPPNWIHLLLPVGIAINWSIALHLWLAGWFTSLWAAGRGTSRRGATLAGAVFILSGPVFLRIFPGHLPHLYVMAWTPLLLWALDRWIFRPRPWHPLLIGAGAVAMQCLAGHPQYVYFTAMAMGLYVMLHSIQRRSLRPLAAIGLMYVLGASIAAVQIGAGLSAAGEGWRHGGVPYDFSTAFSLPIENLITLVIPNVFGDITTLDYFGRSLPWEASAAMGAVVMLLAGAGALVRRNRIAVIVMLMMLVAAMGDATPVHRLLYDLLPGYNNFRAPGKFVYLAALFLAMLAGDGFDRLRAAAVRRAAWIALALAAALLIAGVLVRAFPDALPVTMARIAAAIQSMKLPAERLTPSLLDQRAAFTARQIAIAGGFLGAAGALLVVARRWPAALNGLLVLALIQSVWFARDDLRGHSERDEGSAGLPNKYTRISAPVEQAIPETWRDGIRSIADNQRVLPLIPMLGGALMCRDVQQIWGFDPAIPRRYLELIAAGQGIEPGAATQHMPFDRVSVGVLRMLRCAVVFPPDPRARFMRIDRPLGRAMLLPWRTIPDPAQRLAMLSSPGFDPAAEVLLDEEPVLAAASIARAGQSVALRDIDTDTMEIDAIVEKPSILLITDSYSPAWRAFDRMDSAIQHPVIPADHALIGIPLNAGHHRIRLEYSPTGYRVGMIVSGIGLLIWIGAWFTLSPRPGRRALRQSGDEATFIAPAKPGGI